MFDTLALLLQQQYGTKADRIDVPLYVPFCTGSQWIEILANSQS